MLSTFQLKFEKIDKSQIFKFEIWSSLVCYYMYFDPLITNINFKNRKTGFKWVKSGKLCQIGPISRRTAVLTRFWTFFHIIR